MKKLSKGAICGIIAAIAVVVLIIVLVIMESSTSGRLIINNKTKVNIETLDISFIDDDSEEIVDYLYSEPVGAGDKFTLDYGDAMNFMGRNVTCIIKVLVSGYSDPIVIYDGNFSSKFHGTFEFVFTEDEEDIFLSARAYEGLFQSTKTSDLDTEYVLWPEDADWDYADDIYDEYEDDDDDDEY